MRDFATSSHLTGRPGYHLFFSTFHSDKVKTAREVLHKPWLLSEVCVLHCTITPHSNIPHCTRIPTSILLKNEMPHPG
jgi:hypothetical protein